MPRFRPLAFVVVLAAVRGHPDLLSCRAYSALQLDLGTVGRNAQFRAVVSYHSALPVRITCAGSWRRMATKSGVGGVGLSGFPSASPVVRATPG